MKKSRPTFILLAILILFGLYLHYFTDSQVYWSGYIAMIFFYVLIFYFGTYLSQKREGSNDLMLGNRQVPLWIAIFTMSATWIGGGYINGAAEATLASGLVWVQAPWGYAMSLIIGGLFFAKKMRRYEFKTMLDPLAQRFGKQMGVVLFLPALTGEIFWTAAILTALGATFSTILGIGMNESILLSAVVAIVYTMIGGLWAVALTDIIQLTLILVGLAIVVPFALAETGGWDVVWLAYQEKHGAAATFLPTHEALGSYYWQWWDYALLLMLGGIPWQVYFQRVLASKNEKTAVRLSLLAGVICIIAAIPAIMIGIIGSSIAEDIPNASMTLPHVVRYLTPNVVATIGLGAVAAAVMSSIDSSVLSASSMASWNVYRPIFKPNINQEQLNKAIKTSIWIVGITATLLALQIDSVYGLWFLCSDFVYCLLFPQLVTALFDKKANRYGSMAGFAIAAILRFGGGDITLGLPAFIDYPMVEDGVVLFPFRTLAMVSGLVTIIVVSRLTQRWEAAKPLEKAA